MAGEKGSTARKPTIKIPPQKLPKQPQVAFTYDSDQQLEFPELPAPSIDNNKTLGRLSMKTTSLKLMSWTSRLRKNRDTARIGQHICLRRAVATSISENTLIAIKGSSKFDFEVDLDVDLDMDFVFPKRNQLWNPNHGFRLHATAAFGRVSESQTSCLLHDMTFI
jgi:hypothetical protein